MNGKFKSEIWIEYIHKSRQSLIDFKNYIILEILSNENLTDSDKIQKIKELCLQHRIEHQELLNKHHFFS